MPVCADGESERWCEFVLRESSRQTAALASEVCSDGAKEGGEGRKERRAPGAAAHRAKERATHFLFVRLVTSRHSTFATLVTSSTAAAAEVHKFTSGAPVELTPGDGPRSHARARAPARRVTHAKDEEILCCILLTQ